MNRLAQCLYHSVQWRLLHVPLWSELRTDYEKCFRRIQLKNRLAEVGAAHHKQPEQHVQVPATNDAGEWRWREAISSRHSCSANELLRRLRNGEGYSPHEGDSYEWAGDE